MLRCRDVNGSHFVSWLLLLLLLLCREDLHPEVEIEKGKDEGEGVVEKTQGSRVTLLCHVSYPLHVQRAHSSWLNASEVKSPIISYEVPTSRRGFRSVQLSLVIINVSSQHEGRYVCALNSSAGMYADHVQLQVSRGTDGFTLLVNLIHKFFSSHWPFEFLYERTHSRPRNSHKNMTFAKFLMHFQPFKGIKFQNLIHKELKSYTSRSKVLLL